MATYRKQKGKTPLIVNIIAILFFILILAAVSYPAFMGAKINLETLSLEYPK